MKRKVFLVTLIFMMCCLECFAKEDNIACQTVEGLGIMEIDRAEATVTRGEFARIIRKMCRLEINQTEWQRDFFEDLDTEQTMKNIFSDVQSSGEYYDDINIVCERGIMNGISADEFLPDGEVKYEEAAKTLVKIFGYSPEAEYAGGYPTGYTTVCDNLGISRNVNASKGAPITKKQLAQMIYNSLDIKVMVAKVGADGPNFEEGSKNVLEYVMGMWCEYGTMTANMQTDLYTAEQSKSVVVNDVRINATEDLSYINELLGHKAYAYYNDDGLVWACVAPSDNSIVISGDDVEDFSDGVLTYDNGRKKSITVESGTPVIYNGLAVSGLERDMVVMQGGSIEIIQNDSDCDVVIIKNYKDYYVSGIDLENGIIYNKLASGTENETIDVFAEGNCVVIKNADGVTDLEAIAVGAVLSVAQNDYAIEIIINTDCVSGKITAIGDYIYINDKEYELSREYVKSRFYVLPKLGENVKAYTDAYGYIAWLDNESVENMGGYIIKTYIDEDSGKSIVKMFTLTGDIKAYETVDKVTVIDTNNEKWKVSSEQLSEYAADGYVNYSLSEDGKINKIVLPLKKRTDENHLYEMINDSMGSIRYKSTFKCFSGKAYIGSSTKILLVGSEGGDVSLKLADASIFVNSTDYNLSAYATDPDNMYADCIVYHSSTTASINDSDYAGVVVDIKNTINADDDEVIKATVYRNGSELELVAVINNGTSIFDEAVDVFSSGTSYKIRKGDIIKWSTDFDGYVNKIQLIYSPYLRNPSGGDDGYLAGVKNDKYMVSSALVDRNNDINNIYNATTNSQTRTDCNPYALSSGSAKALAFRFYQNMRTMLGWVYSNDGEIFTMTTQDLSLGEKFSANGIPKTEYKEDAMTGVWVVDNIKFYRFDTTYVDYVKKGSSYTPTVRAGTIEDIKDYKSYGGDCSRVICILKSGEPYQLIIIDNDK